MFAVQWPFKIFQAPYGPPGPDHRPEGPPPLTEQEFEEIMGRNRTVSSSAIARAVSDAAAGEYASAIETLVTAISLIKQSKVAADDRCKILISSLQDTLRGVETKSYGSGRRGEINVQWIKKIMFRLFQVTFFMQKYITTKLLYFLSKYMSFSVTINMIRKLNTL